MTTMRHNPHPQPVQIDLPEHLSRQVAARTDNHPQAEQQADEKANGDLVEIIRAYNQVTDRLQQSHETLNAEVARLQKELASANAALQRSKRLAALGEMAAGIAHEIRNPLASIQLYANMLREDLAGQPQALQTTEKIASAVRGLNAIVNDVLAFSREIRLHPTDGSALDVLENAVDVLHPSIQEKEIHVRYGEHDLALHADREALHQALVNVIRNAVDAMEPGGTLTLDVQPNDGGVQLIVRDTGPGIESDAIDRIFNPFFTTRATGTGLGLAIVHRIVDAHGGTIAVHNEDGAVFTISLPAVEERGARNEERGAEAGN